MNVTVIKFSTHVQPRPGKGARQAARWRLDAGFKSNATHTLTPKYVQTSRGVLKAAGWSRMLLLQITALVS